MFIYFFEVQWYGLYNIDQNNDGGRFYNIMLFVSYARYVKNKIHDKFNRGVFAFDVKDFNPISNQLVYILLYLMRK